MASLFFRTYLGGIVEVDPMTREIISGHKDYEKMKKFIG